MNLLEIPRTPVTPAVHFAPEQNLLRFEGDCYPENPRLFFAPLLEALDGHLDRANPPEFVADFHLRYVNSASTVALRRLFLRLDRLGQQGGRVLVRWRHDPDDDVNEELGRDLAEECTHARVETQPV